MHFSAPKSAPVHESVSADRMVSQLSKLILYITLSRKKKQVVLYQKGVQVSLLTRHNNIHILPLIPFNDYPHSPLSIYFILYKLYSLLQLLQQAEVPGQEYKDPHHSLLQPYLFL